MNKNEFLSELSLSEEDVTKIIESKVFIETIEDIIAIYESGDMEVKDSKNEFFDWLYDGNNELDNIKDVEISKDAVGMTIKEYLVHKNTQIIILSDGRVVYFYE